MTKILLPLNNSSWGVIVHPVASDEYEHVLSFENEKIKTQFIGQELFNDKDFDYKVAIQETEDKPFVRMTDTEGTVSINLDDVNQTLTDGTELSYTLNDLLNLDCMLVEEDGEVKLYAVASATRTNTQNQVTVQYTLFLDVMFNVIDELDLQGEFIVERKHTKRYDGSNFIKNENWLREEDLSNFVPVSLEREEDLKLSNNSLALANEITWCIISVSLKEGEQGVIFEQKYVDTDNKYYPSRLPFKTFIFPIGFDNRNHNGFIIKNDEVERNFGSSTYDLFRDDANIISIKYVKGYPFKPKTFSNIYTRKNSLNDNSVTYVFETDIRLDGIEQDGVSWYDNGRCIEVKQFRENFFSHDLDSLEIPKPIYTSYDQPKEIKNEVKLFSSQLREYHITSKNGIEPFKIHQEFIGSGETWEDIELGYKFNYQPTTYANYYYIKNSSLENYEGIKKGLIDGGSLDLPWNRDKYNEYAARNKWGEQSAWISSGTKMATGAAAGAAFGSIIPGLGTGIGALVGGVGGMIPGLTSGLGHGVMIHDLKQTPDSPVIMSNNYSVDQNTTVKPRLKVYKLPETIEQKAYDFLYKYGYVVGKLDKWDNIKDTRYYFNYIKTDNVFSNIKNRYSANIKQIINDTFKVGFTIWHVRDLDTFKGIVNYDYENQEMELVRNEKDNR